MKLRNKKTGEIVGLSIYGIEVNIRKEGQPLYHSIAELNEEWEDFESDEPLIMDKYIRKAVRVWAYINSIKKVIYCERPDKTLCVLMGMGLDDISIDFVGWMPTLEDGEEYTISELCGEEK